MEPARVVSGASRLPPVASIVEVAGGIGRLRVRFYAACGLLIVVTALVEWIGWLATARCRLRSVQRPGQKPRQLVPRGHHSRPWHRADDLAVTALEQVPGACLEAQLSEQLEAEGVGEPVGRVERGAHRQRVLDLGR